MCLIVLMINDVFLLLYVISVETSKPVLLNISVVILQVLDLLVLIPEFAP